MPLVGTRRGCRGERALGPPIGPHLYPAGSTPALLRVEILRHESEWVIHSERIVDDTRRTVLSIADVELPDGVRFEQYVLRAPAAVMVVLLDAAGQVLMLRRHRFVIDQWVWELPGGYVDGGESFEAAVCRESVEETGWRPQRLEKLVDFQPMEGIAEHRHIVYLGTDVEQVTEMRDVNEAAHVRWVPLMEVKDLIAAGQVPGAGAVTGLLAVLLARAEGRF